MNETPSAFTVHAPDGCGKTPIVRPRPAFDPSRMDVTTGHVGGRRAVVISLADSDLSCEITIARPGVPDVRCGIDGIAPWAGYVAGAEDRVTSLAAMGSRVDP